MLATSLIFLALGVAAIYFTIAAVVVPKIGLPGASPRFARYFRLGAVAFFVGCGLTHLHIAVHAYTDAGDVRFHELGFHVLQVVGGAFFIWAALRFLEIQVEVRKTESERRMDQLEELAIRDPLTGAYNRRYFDEELGRTAARYRRRGEPFAIANLDIDDFKQINDQHGHRAGDETLKRLVLIAHELIRPTDTLVRFGGDEFGLILPGADSETALSIAERIRMRVDEPPPDGLPPMTVSLGIAAYPEHGSTLEELFARSDEALYRSKRSGKDRTIVAPVKQPEKEAPV